MIENLQFDKKSLLCFADEKKIGWRELAKDCVAFANTRGGTLLFGIEDAESSPPENQTIPPDLPNKVQKGIATHTVAVGLAPELVTHENGGEVLSVKVHANSQSLAATTDGRYYYRVGDTSVPVPPDEMPRLLAEKDMYLWEAQTSRRIPRDNVDAAQLTIFMAGIKGSDRVSSFVKEKTAPEILDQYLLTKGEHLTNLGILWIGLREERAQLRHAPVIQFIKFDEKGNKVRKLVWDDHSRNPLELIEAIWTEIPEWREFTEFPDGIFRKQIPHYDEVVIRELIANALVHRAYTTAGDIFINLYPDRLEIHSPGRFPLGVTSANILHKSVRRNDHLAKVFYDLKLMEREGSGFDKIYEAQLSQAKPLPKAEELEDRVRITIERVIVRPELLDFLTRCDQHFGLTQRERIALGIIAQWGTITALEFSDLLDLHGERSRLRNWLGSLVNQEIVQTSGKTRATKYFINPNYLRTLEFSGTTTLKNIELHRLRELILQDLKIYGPDISNSTPINALNDRIGAEIPRRLIRKTLNGLSEEGLVQKLGQRRGRTYALTLKAHAALNPVGGAK